VTMRTVQARGADKSIRLQALSPSAELDALMGTCSERVIDVAVPR
jgi:hypothetical protein